MAEIATLRSLWNGQTKISLCWWHYRRAVRTRLASAKLSTTPYDGRRAEREFSFINPNFKPPGKADRSEYEGGFIDELSPSAPPDPTPNPSRLVMRIPGMPLASTQLTVAGPSLPLSDPSQTKLILRIRRPATSATAATESDTEMPDGPDESGKERRTFCSQEYRAAIIEMLERHYCAHPTIPGFCHPAGIKYWAVKQIYDYCVKYDLRELWAYLWENWYRGGRWELWARSAHPTIPRLKTTMICESQ
jgi:hypothetical protein